MSDQQRPSTDHVDADLLNDNENVKTSEKR